MIVTGVDFVAIPTADLNPVKMGVGEFARNANPIALQVYAPRA